MPVTPVKSWVSHETLDITREEVGGSGEVAGGGRGATAPPSGP